MDLTRVGFQQWYTTHYDPGVDTPRALVLCANPKTERWQTWLGAIPGSADRVALGVLHLFRNAGTWSTPLPA